MSSPEYKIAIKGPELSFEQSVPLDLAKRIVAMAASGGIGVSPSTPVGLGGTWDKQAAAHEPGAGSDDGPALAEYVTSHSAKRIIEQIATIGEYLKVHRRKATFTQEDLVAGFEEAGESVPKNLSRDLAWAKKTGWVAPKAGVDGHYYVTGSGRSAINENFSPEIKAKSKASAGGRKKKKPGAKLP